MTDKYIAGKITFIHHEKNRAVIEYTEKGRKKTIQANIDDSPKAKHAGNKPIRKAHRFLVGDNVSFLIKKTGSSSALLYADSLRYQYNTALEILINKAAVENKFTGYIKVVDNKYFIKEIESYLFFPLVISAFETAPSEKESDKPVIFKLDNFENTGKISASLYNHDYIPEFHTAVKHYKKQEPINAVIYKITAFGIYLNVIGDKIKAKLTINADLQKQIEEKSVQVYSVMAVKIKHISDSRIIIEPASEKKQLP